MPSSSLADPQIRMRADHRSLSNLSGIQKGVKIYLHLIGEKITLRRNMSLTRHSSHLGQTICNNKKISLIGRSIQSLKRCLLVQRQQPVQPACPWLIAADECLPHVRSLYEAFAEIRPVPEQPEVAVPEKIACQRAQSRARVPHIYRVPDAARLFQHGSCRN